jgi:hypothetical protein
MVLLLQLGIADGTWPRTALMGNLKALGLDFSERR